MKRMITLGGVMAAGPALAHHPLAGAPMETFTHGLLSGIGHPLLGFDHLFFVALVGVAALFTGRAVVATAAFVAAMAVGCLVAIAGLSLPIAELMIVASLLVLGTVVALGKSLSLQAAASLFAVFGLFHGIAFAGSIVGQEAAASMPVIVGYLLGLGVCQFLIAMAAGFAIQKLWDARLAGDIAPRLAGAVVAGVGLFLALETAEGAVFAALGLG